MPRRTILTERQRQSLFRLPDDAPTLLRHYVLSDEDLNRIRRCRRPRNRLGLALQLCALRYPGRLLQPSEVTPEPMLAFVAAQLGLAGDDLLGYGAREATRYQHSAMLQHLYGYRSFEGRAREEMKPWINRAAELAQTNDQFAADLLAEFRRRKTIVPRAFTVERLCADALVAAERRIAAQIAGRLNQGAKARLLSLLRTTVDDHLTRFVWLRQFEPGSSSADMNRMLNRLDVLRELDIDPCILEGVPPHRVGRLRRQGEQYYADGLRELPENRKLAILAVCVIEWRAMVADAIVETHDRIVGKLYRTCERRREEHLRERRGAIGDTLKSFSRVGAAILSARDDEAGLATAVETSCGWQAFEKLVEQASALTGQIEADPLDFVTDGYARFRRYAPRLLDSLSFCGGQAATSLLSAIDVLRVLNRTGNRPLVAGVPISFVRPKWLKRMRRDGNFDRQLWETAVLFELRNALRSGDIWLADSRRYREVETTFASMAAVRTCARLAVPFDANIWLQSRTATLGQKLQSVGTAALHGGLPSASLKDGVLHLDRLEKTVPDGADTLVLKLYGDMAPVRITDVLLEVDNRLGFAEAFSDLRTGAPCRDRIGLLTVLLANGVNLGLSKMADACNGRSFWELLRIAKWHVREETYARALAMIVEAQSVLPMARFWGAGETSSSDGQHFPAGGAGEALNVVNARYGNEPGLTAYSHVSDQYAPFATQIIPATAHEAPYILDGLLQNEAGRRIKEHYADTGGFTDHVFATCAILGFQFAPRIRDLPDKRLYAFDPSAAPAILQPLIAGRIKVGLIHENWPDILRLAASMATGDLIPSQILRKLAAYPRQNSLALALREVGRLERTIFIYVTWNLSRSTVARRRMQDAQRRTTVGAMAGPHRRAPGARVAEHAGGPWPRPSLDRRLRARLVGVPRLLRRCRGRSADGQARARCSLRPPPDRAPVAARRR